MKGWMIPAELEQLKRDVSLLKVAQSQAGLLQASEKGYLTRLHHNAQRLLRPLKVVNVL